VHCAKQTKSAEPHRGPSRSQRFTRTPSQGIVQHPSSRISLSLKRPIHRIELYGQDAHRNPFTGDADNGGSRYCLSTSVLRFRNQCACNVFKYSMRALTLSFTTP
jgi:hypothetical protein